MPKLLDSIDTTLTELLLVNRHHILPFAEASIHPWIDLRLRSQTSSSGLKLVTTFVNHVYSTIPASMFTRTFQLLLNQLGEIDVIIAKMTKVQFFLMSPL